MKFAVIRIGGQQFKVKEKDQIEVERLAWKEGETVTLKEVLLLIDDEKVKIGKPVLSEASVQLKVHKHFLGEKLHIIKFKAKNGYRRKTGFRPQKSLVSVEKIIF